MNFFDIALITIVVLSFVSGMRTGLTRVVVHLASVLIGLLAAFWCSGIVAAKIAPWVAQPLAAQIAGFCIIFFGIAIAGSVIAALLAKLFEGIGLGWLDHLLGGAVGFLRGAVLAAAAVAVVMAFAPLPAPEFLAGSKVAPYAASISSTMTEFAPKPLRDGFLHQMETLKHMWMKAPANVQGVL